MDSRAPSSPRVSWQPFHQNGSQVDSLSPPGTLMASRIGARFVTLDLDALQHPEVQRELLAARKIYHAAMTGAGAQEAVATIQESSDDEIAAWGPRLRTAGLMATVGAPVTPQGLGVAFERLVRPEDAQAWTPWLEGLFATGTSPVAIKAVEAVLQSRLLSPDEKDAPDLQRQWQRFQLLAASRELDQAPDSAVARLERLVAQPDTPAGVRHEASQLLRPAASPDLPPDVIFLSACLDDADRALARQVSDLFEPERQSTSFQDLTHFAIEARLTFTGWSGLLAVEEGRRDPELTSFVAHLHDFRSVLERLLNRALVEPFRPHFQVGDAGEPNSALLRAMRHRLSMGVGGLTRLLAISKPARATHTERSFLAFIDAHESLRPARSREFVGTLQTLLNLNFHGINHDEERARQDWQPLFQAIKLHMYGNLSPQGEGLVQTLRSMAK
jgi:hypothetical protein